MFKASFSRWFACGALISVCAGGCAEDVSYEPVDVDDQVAELTEQWVQCAKDGGFCAFSGTRRVRYGRRSYTIRTFSGGVKCDAANFGTSRQKRAHCDVDMSSTGSGAAGAAVGGAGSAGIAGAAGAKPAAGSGGGGTGGVTQPPAAGTGGSTTPPPPASGWRSGVNGDPVLNRASVEAFCSWRGRACGVAHTYTDRTSWDAMTRGSGWVFDYFSGYPGLLVVSQGLVPNGRAADLSACANGTYDQHFRDFGTIMVNKGRGASVVRLGWEFNGTFMPWAATNATVWKQCFQHAAVAIRQTNPSVMIDWTINAHGTPSSICGGSSLNCYPGDAFVDIIGIDNYDHAPSAPSAAEFTRIADAPDGMNWLYNFAKQHGKKFSVGEWGVAPGSDWNTTGENPEFMRYMHQWFAAHASDLVYEAYFNGCIANDVESNLYRPVGSGCVSQNVAAGSLYKSLFGG